MHDDAKEHAIGRFFDIGKLRVRFGGRKSRRSPFGEDRAVFEVGLDRLGSEACENDVSRRVRGEDDS